MASMLQWLGFEFASSTNGHLRLQRVEERRPDLIPLDLNMLIMDGSDFLEEWQSRAERPGIPVVVLSSKGFSQKERVVSVRPQRAAAVLDLGRQLIGRSRQVTNGATIIMWLPTRVLLRTVRDVESNEDPS